MLIRVLAVLFFAQSFQAIGQKVLEVEIGAKMPRRFNIDYTYNSTDGSTIFIGNIRRQSGFFEAKVSKKYSEFYSDFVMYKLSAQGNIIKKFRDKMEVEGKRVSYEGVRNIGENYYLFFSFSNTKKKKNYLFARRIDLENLKLTDEIKEVAAASLGKGKYFFGNYIFSSSGNNDELLISFSTDRARVKRFLGVEYLRKPKTKKRNKSFSTFNGWVYDSDMSLIHHFSKYKLRNNDSVRKYSYGKCIIADNGVIAIAQNRTFRVFDFRTIKNRKFVIVYYKYNGDTLYYYPKLSVGNITDLAIKINPINDNIVIGGPYTITGKGGNGIFLTELDKETLNPSYEFQKPFSKRFIDALDASADSLEKSVTKRYSYENLYGRSVYGEIIPENIDDYEPDDFGVNAGKKKKRKGRKKRKAEKRAKEAKVEKELEILRNDNNSIPVLGKAVNIFFNIEGKPYLVMEKQSSYIVWVAGGATYNNVGGAKVGQTVYTPVSVKGYGDIVIATPFNDTGLRVNYLLKFNGIKEESETGGIYVQKGDYIYVQYGNKLSKIDLNTLAVETSTIPYFEERFKKFFNGTYLTYKPLKYFNYINGSFFGIENRRVSKSLVIIE